MKLRLCGFKGIAAGPALTWDGLQEIEVDFTGKAGLIALAGLNGCGKSTLLENLHHYPQLVSRDGALWQHVTGREAEKEFASTFMGHHYRSLIKMNSESEKQEGFIWKDLPEAERSIPYREIKSTQCSMVNGKISSYKKYVEDLFGQPFTYFRSQFCPQKSKKTREMQIENMTAGVFRELLREFLNLQKYAQWEDTAKQAGNFYAVRVAVADEKAAALVEIAEKKANIELAYAEAAGKCETLRDDKTLLERSLIEKRREVDALKTIILQNSLALQRKADLQAQIDRLEGELAKEKATAEREIMGMEEKWRTIKAELNKSVQNLICREAVEKAADMVRTLEAETERITPIFEELQSNLPVCQKKAHDIETHLTELRQQVRDLALDKDPENLKLGKLVDEAERAVKEKERELVALRDSRELFAIDTQIETAQTMTKALDVKDPACQSTTCSFIVGAIKAVDTLPELKTKKSNLMCTIAINRHVTEEAIGAIKKDTALTLDKKKLRIENLLALKATVEGQIKNAADDLNAARQILANQAEMLAGNRKELARRREEIAKQKALADKLPQVRIAEERKKDLERQLEEVTRAGTARKEAWGDKEAGFKQRRLDLEGLRDEITINKDAETDLTVIKADILHIETVRIPAIETEIQTARDRIATLQAELTRIEAAERELEEFREKRDLLTRNMASWRYLQFGCGKTGIQNLRIDGAAPRIVYNANRLLTQAYGALYSIRLETINEAGKEDLQIKIIMENGAEVYLDDLSGGQRVWNVQALWLAMSLLNQEKSGKRFTYFCADENDGALDPENAEKFTALYRPFMAEANLSRLIFISHKPSCRAMADHVLTFEHGKNPAWG